MRCLGSAFFLPAVGGASGRTTWPEAPRLARGLQRAGHNSRL